MIAHHLSFFYCTMGAQAKLLVTSDKNKCPAISIQECNQNFNRTCPSCLECKCSFVLHEKIAQKIIGVDVGVTAGN